MGGQETLLSGILTSIHIYTRTELVRNMISLIELLDGNDGVGSTVEFTSGGHPMFMQRVDNDHVRLGFRSAGFQGAHSTKTYFNKAEIENPQERVSFLRIFCVL